MNGGARISARAIVMLLVVALGFVALPGPADAHYSALDALTVDLLLDQAGLVVVDAAANGHTYDTAPHSAAQRRLATAVLDALGVPHDTAQVDPDSSTLYHEVGFNVALHEAFANTGVPGAVRIDTAPLQKVAAGVGDLILDVCGVAKPGLTLAVTATSPAAAPDPGGAGAPQTDRTDCQTWARHADDTSVTISLRVGVQKERQKRPRVVGSAAREPRGTDACDADRRCGNHHAGHGLLLHGERVRGRTQVRR